MKLPTKEQTKEWLKNPYNLIFIIILILTIGMRFYYFQLTIDQPVWWDEGEYLSAAKGFAGVFEFQIGPQRNVLFPILVSLFYRAGIDNEAALRFFLLFIPSIIAILLFYFCIKEMYNDKRIALICLVLASVLWEHLFFSNRFQTDNFGLIFGILSTYIIFKMYLKKQDIWILKHKHAVIYIMFFAVIAFLFRTGNIIFIPLSIIYILIIERINFFKKKEVIYGGVIISSLIFIQIIYNYISRGDLIAGYLTYAQFDKTISYEALKIFNGFYESLNPSIPSVLYYLFFLGIIFIILEVYINKNKILNLKTDSEDLNLKADIYSLLNIILMLSMFIVITRTSQYELRWFFPLLIGMFAITAKAIVTVADYTQYFIQNNAKYISTIIVLILLIPGVYYEIEHSDMIIKMKLNSYSQVKEAALWIKENSNTNDKTASLSYTQTAYYSDRASTYYSDKKNEIELLQFLRDYKPKFLTVSIFEIHPQYIFNLTQSRPDIFIPVQGFFLDPQKQQVALIIYQINYNNLKE